MDDQNKNNRPLDQGLPPVVPIVPSVPLDITPQTPPPAITPPVIPEPPMPPVEEVPVTPWVNPKPVTATIPGVPFVPTPTPVESPMPQSKPKKKILPIIGGMAALLLVVGVAGAAYYVANQLSTRQAVAPNAPTSKPLAVTCNDGRGGNCWACCRCNCGIDDFCADPNGTGCNTECESACGGGGGGGGGGATACTRDTGSGGANSCYKNTTESNVCNDSPWTFGCGMECCNTNFNVVCCCTGCYPEGESCSDHGGTTCPTPVNGKWSTWSACSATTCGTNGTKTRTCNNPAPTNGGAECTRTDGTLTTPANRAETEACSAPPCGVDGVWSTWGACSATTCGTSGTKTRTCNNPAPAGGGLECTRTNGSLTIPSNRTETVACSADSCAGACMLINVYKKVDGVYGITPLTTAQLQTLTVGDVLRFTLTSNTDNLRGRFRVTVASVVGSWLDGVIDATNRKLVTYDNYTVAIAGTYQFEAQVSTTP